MIEDYFDSSERWNHYLKGSKNDAAMRDLVEKPAPEEAPSDLGLAGSYVLTPAIFQRDSQDRTRSRRGKPTHGCSPDPAALGADLRTSIRRPPD